MAEKEKLFEGAVLVTAYVKGQMRFNLVDGNGNFCVQKPIEEWFYAYQYINGFYAMRRRNYLYDLYNNNGKLIQSGCHRIVEFGKRILFSVLFNCRDKYNIINQNGFLANNNPMVSQWYDYYSRYYNGFSVVRFNDKYNYVNRYNKLLFDEWFDTAKPFFCIHALVEKDKKYNMAFVHGKLLSEKWFDLETDINIYLSLHKDEYLRLVAEANHKN